MNKRNSSIYELGFIIVFVAIVFQSILTTWVSEVFSYSDEIAAVLGITMYPRINVRSYQPYQKEFIRKWMWLLICVLFLGVVSSLMSKLQPIGVIWVNEMLTFMKFFFVFAFCLFLLQRSSIESLCNKLYNIVVIYIFLGFLFCIANQLIDFEPIYDEYRFGIRNYRFFHSNAGEYSTILIVVISLLHVKSFYDGKQNQKLILVALICMIATTRGKAFGVAAAYIGVLLFLRHRSKLNVRTIVNVVILGVIFGWFQLEKYFFGEESTPRQVLLIFGVLTANTYFPLGAGFGSYGSNMARIHYSPLYYKYGFSNMYGMGEDLENSLFLNDNFWPMIMGQYGWFGVVLYVYVLYCIFKLVYKIRNRNLQISGFVLFFTIVSSSTGGSTIVHYLGSAIMVVFAMVIYSAKRIPTK